MISIILFIFNLLVKPILKAIGLIKDEIRIVRRLPPAKALRANILGITMGLYFVLGITFFQFESVYDVAKLNWYDPFILTLLFMAGPYLLGGFFTILLALVAAAFLFENLSPGTEFLKSAEILVRWNLIGYTFGAVFALLYNDLVYIYLVFIEKKYKIAFAYRPDDAINIIKSPREREEKALLEVFKPITYYTKKIEDAETDREKEENAQEVKKLVEEAHGKMEGLEKSILEDAMSTVSQEPTFDEKLAEMESKLTEDDPSDTITKVEKNIAPLADEKLEFKKHKLYNFDLDEAPAAPYTILFVANPVFHNQKDESNKNGKDLPPKRGLFESKYEFQKDPIIFSRGIFHQAVNRALRSLESNEVVGSPEIWSRIRIVTIFDDHVKAFKKEEQNKLSEQALLAAYPNLGVFTIDGDAPENLLVARQDMNSRVQEILKDPDFRVEIETRDTADVNNERTFLELKHVDVIFGMSGNITHDRSTALFTNSQLIDEEFDDPNLNIEPVIPEEGGVKFDFHPDPHEQKYEKNIDSAEINLEAFSIDQKGQIISEHKHEYHAVEPGRIALNIWGANQKTFIHEFAHAMTSVFNGVITDEYADEFEFQSEMPEEKSNGANVKQDKKGQKNTKKEGIPPFYVNRLERKTQTDGKFIKVHKVFAQYNKVDFYSDLAHPTVKENWSGYFPERNVPGVSCVMDRFTGWYRYRFDKLISNFMYDRLHAKLNRESR